MEESSDYYQFIKKTVPMKSKDGYEDTSFGKKLEKIRDTYSHGLIDEAHNSAVDLYNDNVEKNENLRNFLSLASIFIDMGYLSDAEKCCQKVLEKTTSVSAISIVLKIVALYLLGDIAAYSCRYDIRSNINRRLCSLFPDISDDLIINLIFHMTYTPFLNPIKQKYLAEYYWKRKKIVKKYKRPEIKPLNGRPLRVGYVSADIKLHPVGLFIRGVFSAHNPERVTVFLYYSETKENPILEKISLVCKARNVSELDDDQLEDLIRKDKIDVLIDCSGFTFGTRISVFAKEPAPVLVSWLGYWGTTGLSSFDAVLLDKWHAPNGTEKYFTEPIYRLPVARFCFQPISESPEVSFDFPFIRNGYITFSCFNNTLKFNKDLFNVWAIILQKVEKSKLVLKWKFFQDKQMNEYIKRSFIARGIDESRVELRGWSDYNTMLNEYNDVDIALDTFPFAGGITSCNALWMGVPLVTLISNTVVGRQGYAILASLGLEELAANSVDEYIKIAVKLSVNHKLLGALRVGLRGFMRDSKFLDVKQFTLHLEDAYYDLYSKKMKGDVKKE